MNTQNMTNCEQNTMPLKEPRRKRKVRLRSSKPFPIIIGPNDEWTMYTGHLRSLGVCVVDPDEIQDLHSMGFFGKGSLSRSYPSFEKIRNGISPVVRHRQWARRQTWLEQAKNLDAQDCAGDFNERPSKIVELLDSGKMVDNDKQISSKNEKSKSGAAELEVDIKINENISEIKDEVTRDVAAQSSDETTRPSEKRFKYTRSPINESVDKDERKENGRDHALDENHDDNNVVLSEDEEKTLHPNPINIFKARLKGYQKKDGKSVNVKVDEVVIDSSEEEDEVCEISNIETTEATTANISSDNDIILLNEKKMSIDLEENNYHKTDNEGTNTEDDIELLDREILVLPDSDSDVENYLSNVKPTIEKEGFPVRETMYLTFEESFFLMFGLGCLQVINFDGNMLSILDAWNHFCQVQNDFVQKYVVYHYFRSKGWVVKSGLKYGGDFLLYKQGPPFYHASYIVIVEVLDADTWIRDDNKTTRKMTWEKLFGLDRLSETAAKEILFAQVLWPSNISRSENLSTPELLAEFTVKELLYRRWIPKQKREEIDVENDNNERH